MTDPTPDPRPLVTFALFAYNQEKYIREAVEGAFSQTYEPLEIILSDDCSSDRTFDIMQEMAAEYRGPHRVCLNGNQTNLGVGMHVSTIMDRATGVYVAVAAGDDISLSDRVSHAMSAIQATRRPNSAAASVSFLSALTIINDAGAPTGRLAAAKTDHDKSERMLQTGLHAHGLEDLLCGRLYTSGPSRVMARELHTLFGSIRPECFTEDIIYLFRSALAGKVIYSEMPTVLYRKHDTNLSAPMSLYGKSFVGVAQQLTADLDIAKDQGLVSACDAKRAAVWIKDNISYRKFRRALLDGRRPEFLDFTTLMRASHLSLRRKFGLLREFIGIR